MSVRCKRSTDEGQSALHSDWEKIQNSLCVLLVDSRRGKREERGEEADSTAYLQTVKIDKSCTPRRERSNCIGKEGKNEGLDLDVRGFSVVSEKVRAYSGLPAKASRF